MITRLEATRYRCFERLGIDVGDFRVLVGANGSGKTTLLDLPGLFGDLLNSKNVAEAFLARRRDQVDLPPRAAGLDELVFAGRGSDFAIAVEARLPQAVQARVLEGMFIRARTEKSRLALREDQRRWPTHIRYELGLRISDDRELHIVSEYQNSHQRALVVLDCEWGGSPGKAKIVEHITANMINSGWLAACVRVIAIDPELENWLWQDNPHIADALRYKGQPVLRQWLAQVDLWPLGSAKPPRPKETAEWVLRQTRQPRSSAIYQQLAARIGIHGCTDAAFSELHGTLRAWFPAEATA